MEYWKVEQKVMEEAEELITQVSINDIDLVSDHVDFKDGYKPPATVKWVKLSQSAKNPGKYYFAEGDGSFVCWCLSADRKKLNIARRQGSQQKTTQGAPHRTQFETLRNELPTYKSRPASTVTKSTVTVTTLETKLLEMMTSLLMQVGQLGNDLEDFKTSAMQRLDMLEVTQQLASSQPLADDPTPPVTAKAPAPKRTKSEVNLLDLFDDEAEEDRPSKKRKAPH